MHLDMGLNLDLSQKLVMTPQLCQAITILQLSALDLAELVQQELLDNPVLDQAESLEKEVNLPIAQEPVPTPAPDYFDWADYFSEGGSRGLYTRNDASEPENRDVAACGMSLHEHLELQLDFMNLNEREKSAGCYLIGCIDDNGYLTCTMEDVASALQLPVKTIENLLSVIQGFDPAGVGARNLQECLRIQIRQRGVEDPLIERMIDDYLEAAASGRYAWIAGKIGITAEEVRKAMQLIRTLNPKPGSAISAASPCSYVVPDITVRKIDGEYLILINDTQVPGLRVNPYYKKMARDTDGDARKFIEGRIGSALWLIRSIEQRRQTLQKVMQTIIDLQPDFFDIGSRHLLPMTMKQVADRVGVHESTVSRATANKYVATAHGLFSLRSFFSAGVSAVDGSTMSATRVKREIRELVAAEDPMRPLSDQALTELLVKQGVAVSRRTVAKYREEMEIQPSCRRKK
ncbi:MAG: RNA polymerase factor sigma-54 [Negativicutes bacterium]